MRTIFLNRSKCVARNIYTMLGVITQDTGHYLPPVSPKNVCEYICPDCSCSVRFNGTGFQHSAPNACTYYTEPSEHQICEDARLRLHFWLIHGVPIVVYSPCSNKRISGKYSHANYSTTVRLREGDFFECVCVEQTVRLLYAQNEYTFDPMTILRIPYDEVQAYMDKRVKMELFLHELPRENVFCSACVVERSALCAKQRSTHLYRLPDNLYRNTSLSCVACERDVELSNPQLGEPLVFRHTFPTTCAYYDAPTPESLSLDTMYKFVMFLQWKCDILLHVLCSYPNCPKTYTLRLVYGKGDRMEINEAKQTLVVYNAIRRVQYVFQFRNPNCPTGFYIPGEQIYAFLRKHRRTFMRTTIDLVARTYCPKCV